MRILRRIAAGLFAEALPVAAISAAALAVGSPAALAQSPEPAAREVPARNLSVPTTVSPQMQRIVNGPLRPNWDLLPKTGEEWKALADAGAAATMKNLPAWREHLHVKVEPAVMDGVKVFWVTPEVVAPENRDRLLVHVHGGCYVFSPGEAATAEAILMAGFGHIKVVSVDYRMPPEAYFPAALDDAMTVYKAVLKTTDPKHVGFIGTSAGGALTLEMALRAKALNLPLPGAIASGTPMSDVTKTGDTFHTNEMVDNVLVSHERLLRRRRFFLRPWA